MNVRENTIFNEKYNNMCAKKQLELIKVYSDNLDSLKKYDMKIRTIKEEYQQLLDVLYISRDDSFKAITYLVSKMEGEDYCFLEVPIKLFIPSNCKPSEVNCNLACLVKSNLVDIAKKEISERFEVKRGCKAGYYETDFYAVNKSLNIVGDNYIQLAYYKPMTDSKNIFYNTNNNFIIRYLPVKLESAIVDDRYSYIIDYMDTVVDYRLDKPNFDITLDEMISLADIFVKNYNNNNVNIKLLERKNK